MALVVSCMAMGVVLLNTGALNVALPDIRDTFGADVAELQWVVNAYTVALASFLLSGGALADRLGSKRAALMGTGIFAVGSLLAASAPTVWSLVGAQVLTGTGAALLLPCSVTLITLSRPDMNARARALGVWSAVSATVFALSPVVGGLVIAAFGWRGIFCVNLALASIVAGLVLVSIGELPRQAARRPDLPGQLAAVVALGALTFVLIESRSLSWTSAGILTGLVVAVVATVAFVRRERRAAEPMLPLDLFSRPNFSPSVVAGALLSFANYGTFFVLSLYLQGARGLSPAEVGLVFLPHPVGTALTAPVIGRILPRAGYRRVLGIAGIIGVAGSIPLVTIDGSTPLLVLLVSLAATGVAGGMVVPVITSGVISAVPDMLVGIAASALNASRQFGSVVGVAILGALLAGGDTTRGLGWAMALATLGFAGIALLSVRLTRARDRSDPTRV